MAMTSAALQALLDPAIFAQLQVAYPEAIPFPDQVLKQHALATALATAISSVVVPYIQSNAIVAVTSNGATVPTVPGVPAAIVALPGTGSVS